MGVTGDKYFSCALPNCPLLGKRWKNMLGVQKHCEEVHSDTIDLPLVCEHCPSENKKRFMVSGTLNRHIRQTHPEALGIELQCQVCGKIMNNLKKLQRHEKTHENNKLEVGLSHNCSVCGKYMDSLKKLQKHERTHGPNGLEAKRAAYEYNKELYPVSEMEFEQMKAGEIPKKCPRCEKTFPNCLLMIRHFSRKKKDCGSYIPLKSDLYIEVKDEITGKTRFACSFPDCPDEKKSWETRCNVSSHWESKHSESIDMTVACEYCPKKFLLTATHKIHMRTIHPEKLGLEYHCSKCGKKLKNLKMLIMHEKTHSTDTFHCDFCDYKSNTQAHKNQHMKYNHADKLGIVIKVYHCEHCGKECRHKSNLRQHIESAHSVSLDPKYKCQICRKQLKQDNSFRKHMANVHGVGERCTLCNKLYKNEEALEKHMKGVH